MERVQIKLLELIAHAGQLCRLLVSVQFLLVQILCRAIFQLHLINGLDVLLELLFKRWCLGVVDHKGVDLILNHDQAEQVVIDD